MQRKKSSPWYIFFLFLVDLVSLQCLKIGVFIYYLFSYCVQFLLFVPRQEVCSDARYSLKTRGRTVLFLFLKEIVVSSLFLLGLPNDKSVCFIPTKSDFRLEILGDVFLV